ncbi:MAG: site-specific tyrosine recombinase XerC [Planctomycetaceae bacterium]|nr:site-specific tyrosine recombinase XerC [Planctomycetaceae bacterium]
MAGRPNKPWYRASRNEWYVKIDGVQHRLGPDKAEAERAFHLLMAGEEHPAPEPTTREWMYASEVVDEFQIYIKAENSAKTLAWYCQYLDPFKEQFMLQRADKLSVDAVREWVNKKWKTQPSRRSALRCIKSAFRKAVNECKLMSPIAAVKLPEEANRDHVVTKEEYEKLLAEISDETFSDLVKFVWLTGARPQEAYIIEDSQVDLVEQRIVIPAKKAKGKKRARVIYLPPEALTIIKAKMGKGRIFRTKNGTPFDKDIVRQRFRTLEANEKIAFRFCLYHFRHAFAYRSLVAGVDALTVATLMGHTSTRMLEKVYGHLMKAHHHLRNELAKTK